MKVGVLCHRSGFVFMHQILKELKNKHEVDVLSQPFTAERMQSLMRRIDVLYIEWLTGYLVAVTRMPKTCRIVVRGHASDLTAAYVKQIDWSKVNLLILTNKFMQETFNIGNNNPKVNQQIIKLGVDLATFSLKPFRYNQTIGFCEYIRPGKDVLPVITLMQSLPDWTLKLHAPPTPGLFPELTLKVEKLVHESHNVTWLKEWIPHEKMPSFYHNLDILINNSLREGQGVAILEAMACGVYPLIRNWLHATDLYPEENVYGNLQECREKILSWNSRSDAEKRGLSVKMRGFIDKNYNGARYVREMREAVEQA